MKQGRHRNHEYALTDKTRETPPQMWALASTYKSTALVRDGELVVSSWAACSPSVPHLPGVQRTAMMTPCFFLSFGNPDYCAEARCRPGDVQGPATSRPILLAGGGILPDIPCLHWLSQPTICYKPCPLHQAHTSTTYLHVAGP
jgi:hypothetical protein